MQIGESLGFVINAIAMTLFLPDKKVSKSKGLLNDIVSNGYCTYRFLAKIAGSVISSALAAGDRAPIAQLVEHRVVMREVVSSTPAGPTRRVLK